MARLFIMLAFACLALFARPAMAQTQPCATPAQSNCDLLTGYAVGEYVHGQTPDVWPQTVAVTYRWAAAQEGG